MIKLLYISRNENAKYFRSWATETLFTVQMGTQDAKQKLASSLIGVDVDSIKQVFSCNASKTPVVYLFLIGPAKDMLKDNKYGKNDLLCKFGRSDDLIRRSIEHDKTYSKEFNTNIELLCYSIIDPKFISQAEANISHYFENNKVDYNNEKELVVINSKNLKLIKEQYMMIQNLYIGHYTDLYNRITELEKELKDEKHKYILLTEQHKNKLLVEQHKYELLNDAMGEESSIENLKYDVRFREWLLQSSIFDAFTLNDVLKLKLFASKLLDSINTICELDIKEEFKINNLTFNNYTLQPQDLISILGLRYDTKFNQELYDKNKDSISYGKLSSSISLYYQIFLYLPDVYFGALEKLIKECTKIECLKNIFNGTTTCHEEFLNIFGNPSSSIVEPVVDEPIIEETTLEELSLDEVLQQTANEDIELVKKYGDSVIISTKFGALKLKYSNDIFEIRGDEWNGKNYVLLFEGDENGAKEFLKTAYVVVEGEDYDSSIEDEIVEVVEPPLDSEDDFDWDSLDPDNLDEILGDDINLDNIEI
jgi:hypothetical protein